MNSMNLHCFDHFKSEFSDFFCRFFFFVSLCVYLEFDFRQMIASDVCSQNSTNSSIFIHFICRKRLHSHTHAHTEFLFSRSTVNNFFKKSNSPEHRRKNPHKNVFPANVTWFALYVCHSIGIRFFTIEFFLLYANPWSVWSNQNSWIYEKPISHHNKPTIDDRDEPARIHRINNFYTNDIGTEISKMLMLDGWKTFGELYATRHEWEPVNKKPRKEKTKTKNY